MADIVTKFWNDWLDADEEKRIQIVKKTLIARELTERLRLITKGSKLKKSHIEDLVAHQVNDYFQDLENAMLARNAHSQEETAEQRLPS